MTSNGNGNGNESEDDAEVMPEVITCLQKEETEGKFRRLPVVHMHIVAGFYREKSKDRFMHINPMLSAPMASITVYLGLDIKTPGLRIATGYTRIVSSAHGEFVEFPLSKLAIPVRELSRQNPSAWTTEFQWIGYKYRGFNVYYSDLYPPGTSPSVAVHKGVVKKQVGPKPPKKNGAPHQHPEFARQKFYLSTSNSFALINQNSSL